MAKSKSYWDLFNSKVPIRVLLIELGVADQISPTLYCPFHSDTATGHKSAIIIPDTNVLWCFSERKQFRPKDVIWLLKKDPEEYGAVYFGTSLPPPQQERITISNEDKARVLSDELSIPNLYAIKKAEFLRIESERGHSQRILMIRKFNGLNNPSTSV